jgi:exodeoxyribonuclease VII large subunit
MPRQALFERMYGKAPRKPLERSHVSRLDLEALEASGVRVYKVGELVADLRQSLETAFPPLLVEGEVSNFSRQPSGQLYFTLKDRESQLRCVCFRTEALRLGFVPRDGECLVLFGRCTVYPKTGALQLVVARAFRRGAGEAAEAFERLRERLRTEGLFSPQRKRPIPFFPKGVGIITSRAGAALFDILSVLRRRAPCVGAFVLPVRVQGEGASWEIAEAIDFINEWFPIEVLIVGRGGGSLEDLAAFNDEAVARAVFRSRVPVISAVGHEVNVTICDEVADLRAATPSVAAEHAVPDCTGLLRGVDGLALRLVKAEHNRRIRLGNRLEGFIGRYGLRALHHRLRDDSQYLDDSTLRLVRAIRGDLHATGGELREKLGRLEALSPLATLARGYAIVERLPRRELVRNAQALSPGDRLRLRLAEGEAAATVTGTYPTPDAQRWSLKEGAPGESRRNGSRSRRPRPHDREELQGLQGTLFTAEDPDSRHE